MPPERLSPVLNEAISWATKPADRQAAAVASPRSATHVGLHVATKPRVLIWKIGAFAERTSDESSALDSSSSTCHVAPTGW